VVTTARGLPSNIKKQLLKILKDRLGDSTVNRMVDTLGEDAVLDAVLRALSDRPERGFTRNRRLPGSALAGAGWVATSVVAPAVVGCILCVVVPWVWHGLVEWGQWLIRKFW
jgi:hypothetical protein